MIPRSDADEIPRPATPWIAGVLVFTAAVFLWITVQVFQIEDWPQSAVLLFTACWLGLGVLAMSGFIVQIFTRLDFEGVTQISARGPKQLLWKDVASISTGHQGALKLSDDRTTIIIMPMLYYSAGGVDRWIRNRLERASAPALAKGT
jgi:hypothetical protein